MGGYHFWSPSLTLSSHFYFCFNHCSVSIKAWVIRPSTLSFRFVDTWVVPSYSLKNVVPGLSFLPFYFVIIIGSFSIYVDDHSPHWSSWFLYFLISGDFFSSPSAASPWSHVILCNCQWLHHLQNLYCKIGIMRSPSDINPTFPYHSLNIPTIVIL